MMALLALVATAGLIATAQADKPKQGKPKTPSPAQFSKQLREGLKTKTILGHLQALQDIADENGGNRAAGQKGFKKSAGYVSKQLKSYGWKVDRQKYAFDAFFEDEPTTFEVTTPTPRTFTEDTDFSTMEYSGSGDVTGELVAVDLTIPPATEPSSSSGCEPEDFSGLDLTGKIALMQRGTCDFADKVKNAADAGAVGSVIFNEGQEGRTDVVFGTLGGAADIPAVDTSFEIGKDLANGATNGPTGVTVHIKTTTHIEHLKAENVVGELPGGSGKHVVMAGAHLDSVLDGPGINDNGSGSAALLALAEDLSDTGVKPKNKVRFAWWGAEEEGLVGSTEYVSQLKKKQAKKIGLYLNFDMIGSPNFERLIYDGDGSADDAAEPGPKGSDAIEKTFKRYFKRQDLATGSTAFDGRSDYGPFIDVGIPSGGLFSGAEEVKTEKGAEKFGGTADEPLDPCYHQACDDVDNVSRKAVKQMAPAIADAVGRYSIDLSSLKGGGKKGTPRAATGTRTGDYLGDALAR
jgi:Zn-dependent M28 family amino/carboxypeptidase